MSVSPVIRPGATRRLEIEPKSFNATACCLTTAEVGELFVMLMAEVAMRQIPETKSEHVAAVFAERRVYSRVRGSFGRSPLSRSVRRDVFERDGGACRYCGVSISWGEYECDHVEPVSKGGTDALTNLVAACEPCNRSKGAKTLAEWRRG